MSNHVRTDEELYQLAQKRLRIKKGFLIHLIVYSIVMALLIIINLYSGSKPWFIYPLLGWGIGVAIHGFVTYSSLTSSSEDKIQREIDRIKNK